MGTALQKRKGFCEKEGALGYLAPYGKQNTAHLTHHRADLFTSALPCSATEPCLAVWKWWDNTGGQTSTSPFGEMQSTYGSGSDPSGKLDLPTEIIPSQHQEQMFPQLPLMATT